MGERGGMHINFGAVYAPGRSRQATLGACAWHNRLQGKSQAGGGRERLCPHTNLIAFPFSLLFGGERDKTGLVYDFFSLFLAVYTEHVAGQSLSLVAQELHTINTSPMFHAHC